MHSVLGLGSAQRAGDPPPLSLLERVRPIVSALALYGMQFGSAFVWNNMPPYEPWPGEFVVPGPDGHGARLAILGLEIKALRCMRDPSPAHCSRPDIQRIHARYYLKWLDPASAARHVKLARRRRDPAPPRRPDRG